MGKWGMPVNIVAVVWGVGMALNLAWPREAVYGEGWYNAWGAFIYIGVILGAGLLWYGVKGRHHIGTLESHAAASKAEAGDRSGTDRCLTQRTFDYVIAGGGTAGCVLAARLSEDPDVTVCLVEAGPSDVGDAEHPAAVGVDASARLRLRLGLPGRAAGEGQQLHAARPREGARRLLVAQLVHRVLAARRVPRRVGRDGCHGLERRRNPAAGQAFGEQRRAGRSRARRSGPPAGRPAERSVRRRGAGGGGAGRTADGGVQPRRDGAQRRGLVPDQRRARTAPACRPRTRTCTRSSTPGKNLEVRTGCWVSEILFDDANNATGVRYQRPDLTGYDTVSARREVIVTAGAIDTPKLLMLSGIGPAAHLQGDRHPGPGRLARRRLEPRRPRRGAGVLGGVAADGHHLHAVVGDRPVHHGRRGHAAARPDDALRQRAVRHEHAAARLSDHRQRILPDAQRDSGPLARHGAVAQPGLPRPAEGRPALLHRPRGLRRAHHADRRAAGPHDRRAGPAEGLDRKGTRAGTGRDHRRRAARLRPQDPQHRLPPGGHRQDGGGDRSDGGARPAAAGQGRVAAAGGRRVGDAETACGEPEHHRDDHGREVCGPDPEGAERSSSAEHTPFQSMSPDELAELAAGSTAGGVRRRRGDRRLLRRTCPTTSGWSAPGT